MQRAAFSALVVCAAMVCFSSDAHAQYKNMSWGLYAGVGYWLPAENLNYYREQLAVNGGSTSTSVTANPYSHINPMFHLEFNFKISNNFTWWFKTGVDFGIVRLVSDRALFSDGSGDGGAAIQIEAVLGPRVYFLTDNVRPFLELGVRIPIPGIIAFSATNNFLPQTMKIFPGVYGNFGCEFFVARDVALSIVAGYTRFILINQPGFNSIDGKFGILLYM